MPTFNWTLTDGNEAFSCDDIVPIPENYKIPYLCCFSGDNYEIENSLYETVGTDCKLAVIFATKTPINYRHEVFSGGINVTRELWILKKNVNVFDESEWVVWDNAIELISTSNIYSNEDDMEDPTWNYGNADKFLLRDNVKIKVYTDDLTEELSPGIGVTVGDWLSQNATRIS